MIIKNHNDFIRQTLRRFGLTTAALTGRRQGGRVDDVLTILTRGLRDEFGLSWPEIGRVLGGREHSTVMQLYSRKLRTKPFTKELDIDKVIERAANKNV